MPDTLSIVADNPAVFQALKEVIEKQFLEERTDDSAFSDMQLGQMYRARIVGLARVREAFKEIATHRTKQVASERLNRAR